MNTISERMEHARRAAGLSQSELAKRTTALLRKWGLGGVSRAAVSQWESGVTKGMKPPNLIAVSDVVGCSPRWLATGIDAPNERSPRIELQDLDPKRLAVVFQVIANELADVWPHMEPMSQSAVFSVLYGLVKEDGAVDAKRILTLINTAKQGGVKDGGTTRSRRHSR